MLYWLKCATERYMGRFALAPNVMVNPVILSGVKGRTTTLGVVPVLFETNYVVIARGYLGCLTIII